MLKFISYESSFNINHTNEWWVSLYKINGQEGESFFRLDLPLTEEGIEAIVSDKMMDWDYYEKPRNYRDSNLTMTEIGYVMNIILQNSSRFP